MSQVVLHRDAFMNCPKCYNPGQEPGKPCDNCGFAIPLGHDGETVVLEGMAFAGESMAPGERIGNYEVIDELGRGGMGVVYHVRHELTGVACALKIIRPELSLDEQHYNRFLSEANVARGLGHDNIIRVDQPITDNDLLYFTMDFIPGSDLGKLIEKRKAEKGGALPLFSLEETCQVLLPILNALAFAHSRQQPVIHCDLKPKNVMISGEFPNVRVTVLDFGFARILSAESRSTLVKAEGGDPEYMAPEQWENDPVSVATDLFPVGTMLYHLLTGVIPRGMFSPLSRKVSGLPQSIDDIINRSLQQEPQDRFQDATAMAKALSVVLDLKSAKDEAESSNPNLEPLSQPSPGDMWTEPITGMVFLWVPGGTYLMGGAIDDPDVTFDEIPQHEVTLDGFWLGKYPVTQGQWVKVMESNPSKFQKGDDYPVEMVSWYEAQDFCMGLMQKGSGMFRLPTEAEWEYAARSGGRNEKYAGGNDLERVAWYGGNSGGSTHPVGTKAPNGLGLFDMSGNVWEWMADTFDRNAYINHNRENPLHLGRGMFRVQRGGGWDSRPIWVRSTHRFGEEMGSHNDCTGFRIVRQHIVQPMHGKTLIR